MGVDVRIQLFNLARYRSTVLPAMRQWASTGNTAPVAALLESARERVPEGRREALGLSPVHLSMAAIDRGLRSLETPGKEEGGRSRGRAGRSTVAVGDLVGVEIAHLLAESCLEWRRGFNPDQDMTDSPIVPYLCGRSTWIRESVIMLGPLQGGRLEYSPGESSHLFTPDEARRFRTELGRVEPPDDEVDPESHFENLERILDAAVGTAGLALLRTLT